MTVEFDNRVWTITRVRTADQVLTEFPDKRMGELLKRENLDLVFLREEESPTVELMVLRVHLPLRETIAFMDKSGNILDPDSWNKEF